MTVNEIIYSRIDGCNVNTGEGEMEVRKMKEIKINVDYSSLDEVKEKVDSLIFHLEKANSLVDELASKDVSISVSLND